MRTKASRDINFKYNLGIYWDLISKYKLMIFLIVFFFFIREIRVVLEKFLFKVIIDKGTEFGAGSITQEAFLVY